MPTSKSYKFRIYPTKEQEAFLAKQFGSCRFLYNHFLNYRKDLFEATKKSSNYNKDCDLLKYFKQNPDYAWLKETNSQSLQFSLKCLHQAYSNFYKGLSEFPKFHKRSNDQCIKIPENFKIDNDFLFIPKLKSGIEIKFDKRKLPSKILSLFISKKPSGKYFASFACEEFIQALPTSPNNVGIDLGLKALLITSHGKEIPNPKFYRKFEKKLKYNDRQLSRKQKGSNNKNKQRIKLAKVHERITNLRQDYAHKITKSLIDENQVIVAENLAIKNMIKNPKLSKSIADASWGEIIRQLEYKAKWYGRLFIQVNRFYPSSKTCNDCLYKLPNLSLNQRTWCCPQCNVKHDRDINAAKNILEQGCLDYLIDNAKEEIDQIYKKLTLSGFGTKSDIKQKLGEARS